VLIRDERQVGGAVRIILDGLHAGRHVEDVALEVDDAVEALVATAAMARRETSIAVAAAALALRLDQAALGALLRQLGGTVELREARGGGQGAEILDWHVAMSPGCASALDELDLVARLEGDDGLL